MKDKFLKDTIENQKDSLIYNKAYKSIALNIMLENKHGAEKSMGLDEYDSALFSNKTLFPGHIYNFIYKADKPTVYNDGKLKFEYYDSYPLVLVTHIDLNMIRGINLNLCTLSLRILILNTFYNLDEEFFDRNALLQANKKQFPISNKISSMLLNSKYEKQIIDYIQLKFNLKNIGIIYRNYSVSKIKNPKIIELWLWKYIPFLRYDQLMKLDILQLIYKVTGIDNIK